MTNNLTNNHSKSKLMFFLTCCSPSFLWKGRSWLTSSQIEISVVNSNGCYSINTALWLYFLQSAPLHHRLWMQLGRWNTATGSSGSKEIFKTVTRPGMKSTEVSFIGRWSPTTISSPTRSWSADTWCDGSRSGNRPGSKSFQRVQNWKQWLHVD